MSANNNEESIRKNTLPNSEKPHLPCYLCNDYPNGFVIGDLTRHLIRQHNLVQRGKEHLIKQCVHGCGKIFLKNNVPKGWEPCEKHASPDKMVQWKPYPASLQQEALVFGKKAIQKQLKEIECPGAIAEQKKLKRKARDIKNREAKKNGEAPPPRRTKQARRDDHVSADHQADYVEPYAAMPPEGFTFVSADHQADYVEPFAVMPPEDFTFVSADHQADCVEPFAAMPPEDFTFVSADHQADYVEPFAAMPPEGFTFAEPDIPLDLLLWPPIDFDPNLEILFDYPAWERRFDTPQAAFAMEMPR